MVCYVGSYILDAFDGMAARALKQCSQLGCVLDMVCDRTSDALIVCILG